MILPTFDPDTSSGGMLLVDGDPTSANVLADPQRDLVVIIKNGPIFKNTLPAPSSTPQSSSN